MAMTTDVVLKDGSGIEQEYIGVKMITLNGRDGEPKIFTYEPSLPEINKDEDEGKVLGVIDGKWDKMRLPETSGTANLPEPINNGDILTVVNGEWLPQPPIQELPTITSSEDEGKILGIQGNEWVKITLNPLPVITQEHNGQVLTAQNGTWLPQDVPKELPTLDESDDGLILRASGTEWIKSPETKELPNINEDDNSKVLTVINGIWQKEYIPTELPKVSLDNNGQVLKVQSGEWQPAEEAQSNWQQNNIISPDYIKNRPFYDKADLLPQQTLSFQSSQKNNNYIYPLIVNSFFEDGIDEEYYNVYWNGIWYEHCKCRTVIFVRQENYLDIPKQLDCHKVIGNQKLWETLQYTAVEDKDYDKDLPFVFALSQNHALEKNATTILTYLDYNCITTTDKQITNTIAIAPYDSVVRLDKKYLPSEALMQANWEETNSDSPSFIQNKPSLQSDWNENNESSSAFIKNKPDIPNPQIQADWEQDDETALDYIKNKPNLSQTLPTIEAGDNGKILMIQGDQWAKIYKQQLPETNYSKDTGKILYCNKDGSWDKLDSNYIIEAASLSWNTFTQPTTTFSIPNLNNTSYTAYQIVNDVYDFPLDSFKNSLWTFYTDGIPSYSNISLDILHDIYGTSNDKAAIMSFTRLDPYVFFCLILPHIYNTITISVPSPGYEGDKNPIGTITLEPDTPPGLYMLMPSEANWNNTISGIINYNKTIYQTQSQADWLEFNSTKISYIKNRPCYVTGNQQFTFISNYYQLEEHSDYPLAYGVAFMPTGDFSSWINETPPQKWKLTIGNKSFIGTRDNQATLFGVGNPIYANLSGDEHPDEKFYLGFGLFAFELYIDKNEIELTNEPILITLEALEDLTYHPLDYRFLPKEPPIYFGPQYAGQLLYVNDEGYPQVLQLGRGLRIDNGVLNVTISGSNDSSTAELDVGTLDNIILE